jgi:hypothetical protein
MSKNTGKLYALSNQLWRGNYKIGLTTQKIEKRISNLQTSLFIDCELITTTEQLLNCRIYEFLLKKVLKEYRLRTDREFFNVNVEIIEQVFETFNYLNSILNTEEKLNNYMMNNYPEYFKKRKYIKNETSSSCGSQIANKIGQSSEKPKKKKKKILFVDTTY